MGYACPVCGTPQADARHLANHLAFTAMLHGEGHEAWLDEHAPDWETAGEATLASRVVDLAEDADYPQVFEDTTGRADAGDEHGHGNAHAHEHEHGHDDGRDDPPAERSGALFEEGEGTHTSAGEGTGSAGPAIDPASARERGSGEMDAETREIVAEARALTREMLADRDADGADDTDDTDDGDATDGE